MKKIAFCLATAAIALAGCFNPGIPGNGVIKTENRQATEFVTVEATGGYEIKWSAGKPSVTVETDENLQEHIKTKFSGDTLNIDVDGSISPSKGIKIVLSSAALGTVKLTGGIKFNAGQITGRDLHLESTGASDITVGGTVDTLKVDLTGASHLSAKSLQSKSAKISLTGASDAHVNVSDALKAEITGAGSLTYSGDPKSVEKSVTGAGVIRKE